MGEKFSFLWSEYTVSGVRMPLKPAAMLSDVCREGVLPPVPAVPPAPVADESIDFSPATLSLDHTKAEQYLDAIAGGRRSFPLAYPESYTCLKIAEALLDAIWKTGHFRLGDLSLRAAWKWASAPIGNMDTFYKSVEAASSYLDGVGVHLSALSVTEGATCSAAFKVALPPEEGPEPEVVDEVPWEMPFRTPHPTIGRRRRCPDKIQPEPSDWLIYIPFDSCDYKLGGSLLTEALGETPAVGPDISDTDYFIDCFEIVRELIEDGVIKAGVTVSEGGLIAALKSMATSEFGCTADISDIMKAYGEESPVRMLFSEVPGILAQISDIDYDYVDAELLLQDVAYFPIGHPTPTGPDKSAVSFRFDRSGGIALILKSLLSTQTSEGED